MPQTETTQQETRASSPKGELVKAIPDTSLMTKIGRTGYSFSEILAEFIDNSLDAREEKVRVEIGVDKKRVTIVDNARGMDKRQLIEGITIAKSRKKNALGEYGMGMKAAAVALGRHFSIQTCPKANGPAFRVTWDAAEWQAQNDWVYRVETIPGKHVQGTTITVSELNFAATGRVGNLRTELGKRFGPFLRRGDMALTVNGVKCRSPQSELLPESELSVRNPQQFELKTDHGMVTGWVGLLANSSQKGLYGFDTFRRGRMITAYDKLGFTPHPTVARIVGEINMDFVPVTSDKREWIRECPEYEAASAAVGAFIKPWLEECRKLSSRNVILKSVEQSRFQKLKEGLLNAFQSPDLKEFTLPQMPGGGGKGTATVSAPVEQRSPREGESEQEPREPQSERERKPRETKPDQTKKLKVRGKTFDYEHKFGDLGAEGPWMDYQWDADKRHLLVITNQESHATRATKDVTFLAFMHVVDAVSQILMTEGQGDWSKYDDVRQLLLRESAKHVATLRED